MVGYRDSSAASFGNSSSSVVAVCQGLCSGDPAASFETTRRHKPSTLNVGIKRNLPFSSGFKVRMRSLWFWLTAVDTFLCWLILIVFAEKCRNVRLNRPRPTIKLAVCTFRYSYKQVGLSGSAVAVSKWEN